jgi:hypothetical protein
LTGPLKQDKVVPTGPGIAPKVRVSDLTCEAHHARAETQFQP